MNDDRERMLREAFAAQKAEDAAGAPDFGALIEAAAERRSGARFDRPSGASRVPGRPRRFARLALAAAAGIVLLLVLRRVEADRSFEATLRRAAIETQLGTWRAPSDALLDFPGRDYYHALPRVVDPEGLLGSGA